VQADLGMTEILEPLTYLLKQPLHATFPRQIIVLTDGDVSDPESVIKLVKKNTGIPSLPPSFLLF
jgi:hypothetical protein